MADGKTEVQKAAGTAGASGGGGTGAASGLSSLDIQAAMDEAAEACAKKGITDPDEIREAKLAAREKVKADYREAEAKRIRDEADAAKKDR
jgi:hypothetical protein